jgi:hypothetical protein
MLKALIASNLQKKQDSEFFNLSIQPAFFRWNAVD